MLYRREIIIVDDKSDMDDLNGELVIELEKLNVLQFNFKKIAYRKTIQIC
jgi:hypothetical protein